MFKFFEKILDKSIHFVAKAILFFIVFTWFYVYFLEKFEPEIWGGFWIFAVTWLALYLIIRYLDEKHYLYCIKNHFPCRRWDYERETKIILSSFLLIMMFLTAYEIIKHYNSIQFSDFINKDYSILIIILFLFANFYYIKDFFYKKEIIDFCIENNYIYEDEPEPFLYFSGQDIISVYNNFKPFKIDFYTETRSAGLMREDKNNKFKITLCDYEISFYETPNSRKRKELRYTVCEVIKEDMLFPIFTLRDEKFFFDTVNSSIGREEDIDFYKDKEFSDRFFLNGDIDSLVRRFFNDKLRESIKKYHIKGVSYMGKPKALLFCHEGFMSLKQRKAFIYSILNIFNTITPNNL